MGTQTGGDSPNSPEDPYANLAKNVRQRKLDYLRRLTTSKEAFLANPVENGTASRRGYLLSNYPGHGRAPQVSEAEEAETKNHDKNNKLSWYDTPAKRIWDRDPEPPPIDNQSNWELARRHNPWEVMWREEARLRKRGEDVNLTLARLKLAGPGRFDTTYQFCIPSLFEPVTVRQLMVIAVLLTKRDIHASLESRLRQLAAVDTSLHSLLNDIMISLVTDVMTYVRPEGRIADDLPGAQFFQTDSSMPQWLREVASFLNKDLCQRIEIIIDSVIEMYANDWIIAYKTVQEMKTGTSPSDDELSAIHTQVRNEMLKSFGTETFDAPIILSPPPTEDSPDEYSGRRMSMNRLSSAVHFLSRLCLLNKQYLQHGLQQLADLLLPGDIPDRTDKINKIVSKSPFVFGALFARPYMDFPDKCHVPDHPDKFDTPDIPDEFDTPHGKISAWPEWTDEGVYWWRVIHLSHCIEHVLSVKDTADFHVTDLLRLYFSYSKDPRVPDYVKQFIRHSLLHFKYWIDERPSNAYNDENGGKPTKEEMTFWSENHQIQFYQSEYLVGQLFPDDVFPRATRDPQNPVKGRDHKARAVSRLHGWLDNRLRFGFSEWNAPGYYNEDFPPLFNLVDFCDDISIKTKAAMVLDLLVFDLARFTCRGSFGVSAGRGYFEHKNYGWGQSVGNLIEILFGSRGEFVDRETAAISFATSEYDVPEVLLAIGQDRRHADRDNPFIDRSRVSITMEEANGYGLSVDNKDAVVFWWGNGAYFGRNLEATKKMVEANDNLRYSAPFKLLYLLGETAGRRFLLNLVSATLDAVQVDWIYGMLTSSRFRLPFPLNLVPAAIGIADIVSRLDKIIGEIVGILTSAWEAIFGGDDDKPEIPDSTLQLLLEDLLDLFNRGSVLSRANLYTYCDGDALLSSIQHHLPGDMSFQKHPWQATLDCGACVWTSARMKVPGASSFIKGMGNFLVDACQLRVSQAVRNLALPLGLFGADLLGEVDFDEEGLFGHEGINYWTGSLSLPMIAQYENAAIIIYSFGNLQREVSEVGTHAWFPQVQFDHTEQVHVAGGLGTWSFGRKGDGFVALFSARKTWWNMRDGDPRLAEIRNLMHEGWIPSFPLESLGSSFLTPFDDPWPGKKDLPKDVAYRVSKALHDTWIGKELLAEDGNNIWVCVVGSAATFLPSLIATEKAAKDSLSRYAYEAFKESVLHASLNYSLDDLRCSFDIPAPPRFFGDWRKRHRLELFYNRDGGTARIDDRDLSLDEFPRFENRYVTGAQNGRVDWGARRYQIHHARTGLSLFHDLNGRRNFNRQIDQQVQDQMSLRRLEQGSLTTLRWPGQRRKHFQRDSKP